MPSDFNPDIEYLMTCSRRGLRDFELTALNACANSRKELRVSLERLAKAEANVLVVNWFLKKRAELEESVRAQKTRELTE